MTSIIIEGESGATEAGWSRIQDYLRCPKAYQFKEVRKLHRPVSMQLDHFSVGTLVHAGVAKWFVAGMPDPERQPKRYAKVLAAMEKEAMASKDAMTPKAMQDACRYVLEYAQHWKMRPKPTVVATEYKLGPAPLWPGEPEHSWRTARLDDVSKYAEAGGQLCIGERKTTSASVADTIKQYQLHGQIIMQTLLWDSSKQGAAMHGPIAGVVLDVIQKGYNTASKFGRVFLPVSAHQKKWFAESMKEPLLKAAMMQPDSFNIERRVTGCTFMAGRGRVDCDFKELCATGKSALGLFVKGPKNEKPGPKDWE